MADFFTFDQLQNWTSTASSLQPPARLAVIGDPIGHSKSPQMHNPALRARGLDAQYIRVQVPAGQVKTAFACFVEHGFFGANITIPHKFEALEVVDEVDPLARRLGAVNTLAIRQGRLYGYNTDGPGFLRSVSETFGIELKDLRVLILGAGGGAGRAVAVQSALAGCRQLTLANRTVAKLEPLAKELAELGAEETQLCSLEELNLDAVDLIVNATSVGMKVDDAPLLPSGALQRRHLVYDMVYRASGATHLVQTAQEVGARWTDGMSLLLHQGAISFEHWFPGQPAPLEAMRAGLVAANAV